MDTRFNEFVKDELTRIQEHGLYKSERVITSTQSAQIEVKDGPSVLNLCANNYLGLADNAELVKQAQQALETHGYGMASVRFICGTQQPHKDLEARISGFLGFDDTVLYSSCFDANTGLFETLLGQDDAILSDALNHASIIDGVRLCKARRYRYRNNELSDLEEKLWDAREARFKLIATDGVFSMDGTIANLSGICDLADQYGAMVMVDDSHAVGFMGHHGRGTPEYCGVEGRVDLVTGTLGKALGGASGGFVCANTAVAALLRQRSRPYLFSNTLTPVIAATSLHVLDMVEQGRELRDRLKENTRRFRSGLTGLGFDLIPGEHPIIPVMLGDAALAQAMADDLLAQGVYVIGFSYPVVPEGKARIRTQMSAAHTADEIDKAIEMFGSSGKKLGVI